MQNSVGERLKILIEKLNLSYNQFAKKVGIPYRTIQDYLSGKRFPGGENLQKIASQLRVNLNWLLTGEGDMFIKKTQSIAEVSAEYGVDKFVGKDFVLIPMVSGGISAGKGLTPVDDADIEIKLAFRLNWIKRKGDYTKMRLIRVEGDSMEPTLFDGDIVLVDGNRNFIAPQGGIYAIILFNEALMIKRVQPLLKEKTIKIISDNAKYEPVIVSPEDIYVIGKVIWVGREMERT